MEMMGLHSLLVGVLATLSFSGASSVAIGGEVVLSQAEAGKLVTSDLARRLKVPTGSVTIVEAGERTWPDRRLGCVQRRGIEEPSPVAGYLFVLEASGKKYTYHADREGRFAHCQTPRKPLGPMLR